VAAGLWAVFTFYADHPKPTPPSQSIEVHNGNVFGSGPNEGRADGAHRFHSLGLPALQLFLAMNALLELPASNEGSGNL
jgi:hypothetical protein